MTVSLLQSAVSAWSEYDMNACNSPVIINLILLFTPFYYKFSVSTLSLFLTLDCTTASERNNLRHADHNVDLSLILFALKSHSVLLKRHDSAVLQ